MEEKVEVSHTLCQKECNDNEQLSTHFGCIVLYKLRLFSFLVVAYERARCAICRPTRNDEIMSMIMITK